MDAPPRPARSNGTPANASESPLPLARQLPAHRGKLERVTDHLKGLTEDVTEYVDLRIKLLKAEVEEKIEGRVSVFKGLAIVGAVGALAGLFGLVTLALWIGVWLGRAAWGFLVVTMLLAVGTWIAKLKFAPGKIRIDRSEKTGKMRITHDQTPAEAEGKS